jgi:hypothetical protein
LRRGRFGREYLERAGGRGDAGEALIVGIQCARHGGKARHEPVGADFGAIGAGEQPLDVVLLTDNEVSIALFD